MRQNEETTTRHSDTAWRARFRALVLLGALLLTAACAATPTPTVPAPTPTELMAPPTATVAPSPTTTRIPPTSTRPPATRTPTSAAAGSSRPSATKPQPTAIPTRVSPTTVAGSYTRVGLAGQAVSAFAISSADSKTIFAGDAGLLRSTDGGASWQVVRTKDEAPRVTAVALAPDNPQFVYVGVSDDCTKASAKSYPGYASQDGGKTWRKTLENINYLAVDPRQEKTVYAGTCNALFRSADAGQTWQEFGRREFAGNGVFRVAILPTSPRTIFVAYGATEDGVVDVRRSIDDGATWEEGKLSYPKAGLLDFAIDQRTPGLLMVSTTRGLLRSTDSGATWEPLSEGLSATTARNGETADARVTTALVADPQQRGHFWVGSGGSQGRGVGIYRTYDGGAIWRKVANGLEGSTINTLVTATVQGKTVLYAGTADGLWVLANP